MADIVEKLRNIDNISGDIEESEIERISIIGDAAAAEIERLRADAVYQAKLLVRLRDAFINIRDELCDEGDRVYFGSTNDADMFRDIVDTLDNFKWSQIEPNSKGHDIYEEARNLRAALAEVHLTINALYTERDKARAALAEAREVIEVLRAYGNKECTAMADRELARRHAARAPERNP